MLLPGMKHTRSLLDVSIRVLEYFATHATARNWLAVLWKCRADATDWHARSLECHLNSSACHPRSSSCHADPSNCHADSSDCHAHASNCHHVRRFPLASYVQLSIRAVLASLESIAAIVTISPAERRHGGDNAAPPDTATHQRRSVRAGSFSLSRRIWRAPARRRIRAARVGGVEMWCGGGRSPLNCCRPFRLAVSQSRVRSSVSTSRSSNRTGPIKASGSRTRDHAFAHGRLRVSLDRRMSPNFSYRYASG